MIGSFTLLTFVFCSHSWASFLSGTRSTVLGHWKISQRKPPPSWSSSSPPMEKSATPAMRPSPLAFHPLHQTGHVSSFWSSDFYHLNLGLSLLLILLWFPRVSWVLKHVWKLFFVRRDRQGLLGFEVRIILLVEIRILFTTLLLLPLLPQHY